MIELEIVLVGEVGGLAGPERLGGVDHVVLVGVDIFAILPLLDLAADDGHGQEPAVFLQQGVDARLLQELLVVVVDVEDDVRSAVGLVGGPQGK